MWQVGARPPCAGQLGGAIQRAQVWVWGQSTSFGAPIQHHVSVAALPREMLLQWGWRRMANAGVLPSGAWAFHRELHSAGWEKAYIPHLHFHLSSSELPWFWGADSQGRPHLNDSSERVWMGSDLLTSHQREQLFSKGPHCFSFSSPFLK